MDPPEWRVCVDWRLISAIGWLHVPVDGFCLVATTMRCFPAALVGIGALDRRSVSDPRYDQAARHILAGFLLACRDVP
jgi:hypothetical protein